MSSCSRRSVQTRLSLRRQTEKDQRFLQDFDPEKSSRERRKLSRRTSFTPATKAVCEDRERGKFRDNFIDNCDCLDEKCPGCFYDCPICDSPKCGPTCRVNRRFSYDGIEYDGKEGEITNKYAVKN